MERRNLISIHGQKYAVESTYWLLECLFGTRIEGEFSVNENDKEFICFRLKPAQSWESNGENAANDRAIWPLRCGRYCPIAVSSSMIKGQKPAQDERRKWPRLPLAIPVFVRTSDEKGKDLLEFATALNISAGGALVAVRRSLPLSTLVLLEIPSAPLMATSTLPKAARNLRAKALWEAHANGYQLLGVKFASPLTDPITDRPEPRRKVAS